VPQSPQEYPSLHSSHTGAASPKFCIYFTDTVQFMGQTIETTKYVRRDAYEHAKIEYLIVHETLEHSQASNLNFISNRVVAEARNHSTHRPTDNQSNKIEKKEKMSDMSLCTWDSRVHSCTTISSVRFLSGARKHAEQLDQTIGLDKRAKPSFARVG
jgi:hypothetical protein